MSLVILIALALSGYLTSAWLWMLLVGVAHHEWWQTIPTISYAGSMQMLAVVYLGLLLGTGVKLVIGSVR